AKGAASLAPSRIHVETAVLYKHGQDFGKFRVQTPKNPVYQLERGFIRILFYDIPVLDISLVVLKFFQPQQPCLEFVKAVSYSNPAGHSFDERIYNFASDVVTDMPRELGTQKAAQFIIRFFVGKDRVEFRLCHLDIFAKKIV